MRSHHPRAFAGVVSVAALFGSALAYGQVHVTVDANTHHQVMNGWEVVAWAGHEPSSHEAEFLLIQDELMDRAVDEVGINRVRLEVRSGAETDVDYWTQYQQGIIPYDTWRANRYATVNDNGDPNSTNASGFIFSELDHTVVSIVEPLRQRLVANGEALYVNLNYVAFTAQITSGAYHHDDADEYAEFVLATYQHLDNTYGWVPDAWEIILEPDNVSQWNGTYLGQAMVAAQNRLLAAGYTPRFVAPSNTNMGNAATYFDGLAGVAGALTYLDELCYHRYGGVSPANLQALVTRGNNNGLKLAMLEWWNNGNTIDVFLEDLIDGQNSAIQQSVLAGPAAALNELPLYSIDVSNPANPTLTMTNKTRLRRQYYKWVRLGAQRIDASSDDGAFVPAAFINTDQAWVVVVQGDTGADIEVSGLPAGTYHANYSTQAAFDVQLADQSIGGGQSLSGSIPEAGVITFYGDGIPQGGAGGGGGTGGSGALGGGGTSAGGGGSGATGGTGANAGAPTTVEDDDGCGCTLVGRNADRGRMMWLLVGLALTLGSRRRDRRRP